MTPAARPGIFQRYPAAVLLTLTAAAALLHVAGQSLRPIWLDEAATYWVAQGGVRAILNGIGMDGTPPLYYLVADGAMHAFGGGEFALRLPSLVAAVALVPMVYLVMRYWTTVGTALVAAALVTISPLVHYYAIEARNYALLQLETVAILYALTRVTESPREARWWALLAVAQTAQLWTHIYGVFFLPVPALASLIVGARETRRWRVLGATITPAIAFGLCLPWLRVSLSQANTGVSDWIRDFWTALPPLWAIARSLEVFGFGGQFPSYLSYMGIAPSLRPLALTTTFSLLTIAALPWHRWRANSTSPAFASMLVLGLAVPLLGPWTYSLIATPLYLPGRYDTIVLPVFLMLMAVGLARLWRLRRWAGGAAAVALVWLAVLSWSPALGPTVAPDPLDRAAGLALAHGAAPGDRVISTSLREMVTAYYAVRAGFRGTFSSFPSEINQHRGWYSAARLLQDRTRLKADGEAVARSLAAAAREGHGIWILASAPNEVDQALWDPLLQLMDIEDARSHPDALLLHLTLRTR